MHIIAFKHFKKGQQFLLLTFLLLHTIVAAIHISQQDITGDERDYYNYGIRWLHGQVDRVDPLDDSKSPFTVLSAIPRSVIQLFKPGYKANDNGRQDLLMGRYLMVVYTWIIAIYFFVWCRQLFGERSWILPLLFFLFDPLVLSYSMLVISDMATGACIIAVLYHCYQFYLSRSNQHYLWMSVAIGLSCVAKPSLIFIFPCLGLLWIFLLGIGVIQFQFKKILIYSFSTVVITLLVINLLYFFKNTFMLLGTIETKSQAFNFIIQQLPFLKNSLVPVPQTYYQSLDLLQLHKEIGGGLPESTYTGVFLNGERRLKTGFWYYYFVVGWYKIPLATLGIFITALVTGIVGFNKSNFIEKHIWYIWPLVFFLFVLSFLNTFQIGLRHILMIYPLFFLAVAGTLHYLSSLFRYTMFLAWAGFAGLLISIGFYFPNLIPYTNELVADKKMVYKKMLDSNVDYSQALQYIPIYVKQHPDVQVPSAVPKPGKYIISIHQMLDDGNKEHISYTWYQKFEPVNHYKYSLLIFNISEEDLVKAGL